MEHHEVTRSGSSDLVAWWKREIGAAVCPAGTVCRDGTATRCGRCWLRTFQCYCPSLDEQAAEIRDEVRLLKAQNVEIVMYYHYAELGRSANTAHVFEALCPDINRRVIYGNAESEGELFRQLKEETEMGINRTCVLYPSPQSVGLDCWLNDLKAETSQRTSASSLSSHSFIPSVRLILLDGTYPGASRMARFLQKAATELSLRLPFVALDLDQVSGCRSAVAGVMYQPAKDKICTFQATALALQQIIVHRTAGEREEAAAVTTRIIGRLLGHLDRWIECLLEKKIKMGKSKTKFANKDVDNSLDERMQEIQAKALLSTPVKKPSVPVVIRYTARFTIYEHRYAAPAPAVDTA